MSVGVYAFAAPVSKVIVAKVAIRGFIITVLLKVASLSGPLFPLWFVQSQIRTNCELASGSSTRHPTPLHP